MIAKMLAARQKAKVATSLPPRIFQRCRTRIMVRLGNVTISRWVGRNAKIIRNGTPGVLAPLPPKAWHSGLLEPLKFGFCSRFSLRGVHYYALGGDFKGRQPLA